jgi:hypothetical protein
MVSAGVGNHTAPAFLRRQRRDLVVRTPQFESPDGLQVLGLEIKQAVVVRAIELVKMGLQQPSANGDAV